MSVRCRAASVGLPSAAALIVVAHAAVALPGLELEWSAPGTCPAGTSVEARVATLLAPSAAEPRAVVARARVEQRETLFHLELSLDGSGLRATRELDAPSCPQLAEAAALLIALAIDPELSVVSPIPQPALTAPEAPATEPSPAPLLPPPPTQEPARPAPAPKPQPKPEPEPERPPPSAQLAPLPSASSKTRPWFAVAFDAALHDDGLPGVVLGLGARGTAGIDGFSATVGATEQLARAATWRDSNAAGSGAVDLKTRRFELAFCHLWSGALRVGPCIGVGALYSQAGPQGVQNPVSGSSWWAQAQAAAMAQLPIGEVFGLSGELGGGMALSPRPSFEVRNLGVVAEGRPFSVYGRVGVFARFD